MSTELDTENIETNESNNGVRASDIEAFDKGLDDALGSHDATEPEDGAPVEEQVSEDLVETEEAGKTLKESGESEREDDSSAQDDAPSEKPQEEEGEKKPVETEEAPLEDENGPITPPPNINPKNLGNFRRLEAVARKASAETAELREKVAALETSPNGIIPEPVEKELSELRQFRAMHDLRNDPEFTSKYSGQIKTHEETVATILKKNGAKDDQVEALLKNGLTKYPSKWWDDNVFGKIPSLEADRVKRSILSITDLDEAKDRELKENAEKIEEIALTREQQQQQAFKRDQDAINQRSAELFSKMPWAMRREVSSKATADQRKEIEEHNKNVEQLEDMFNRALFPEDPRHRAEIAVAAVTATKLAAVCNQQVEELEKLREENAALKSSRKLPASKASPQSVRKSSSNAAITDGFDEASSDEAIERGLDEAMGD